MAVEPSISFHSSTKESALKKRLCTRLSTESFGPRNHIFSKWMSSKTQGTIYDILLHLFQTISGASPA
jgi:hypothetical protein